MLKFLSRLTCTDEGDYLHNATTLNDLDRRLDRVRNGVGNTQSAMLTNLSSAR